MTAAPNPAPTAPAPAAGPVRLGLLGCGTVGGQLVRILADRADALRRYTGLDFCVTRVAVRDPGRDRGLPLPADVFSDDPMAVATADDVDLVIELMGGIDPTGDLVAAALAAHKPVVTANKALIAHRGAELFDLAAANGVEILFEAAVGGAIPLIRPITESLAGEDIARVMGIVNGTTNYILTRMAEEGGDFGEILADAQRLGYAEADPTADVDGHDAAQKAAILASLAFGTHVGAGDVHCEGIRGVTARDIEVAAQLGYTIKLLAIAEYADATPDTTEPVGVSVRVHPALLPDKHPLASVRLSFNAVFVEGASAGELMFYGRGAGGDPTAIAVLGDVIDAARNAAMGARGPHRSRGVVHPVVPIDRLASRFYVRLDVRDRPGVLAAVASAFGDEGVSIRTVLQVGREHDAELVLVTHTAREDAVARTLDTLRGLDAIEAVACVLRVAGEDDA